ncbi:MAG: 50S ribosomal protein L29 [Thaumarchaeota archaeon]|nr:50S ribosomal protein L29 [Nitrososphaerota archaeon]
MNRLKAKTLREQTEEDLQKKLSELGVELSKLRNSSARGTIKKDSGKVRAARRNVARILTVLNEKKRGAEVKTQS